MDVLTVHRSGIFADADFLVCIVPAVSLGRPRAGGLPPGCSDMGPGPPRRGLLHPFCRHLSGEQALATEGTNGGLVSSRLGSAALMKAAVFSSSKMTHREEATAPESIDDMPPLSSTLLSVILKSPSVTK